jgi:hypothetical protein
MSDIRYAFELKTIDGVYTYYETVVEAHVALGRYAQAHGLVTHTHTGNWAGNVASVAYTEGGDMLLNAKAVVREVRR